MHIDVTVDDNLPAVHVYADIASGIALDEDLPAGHPPPVSTVGSTEHVPGISFNDEFPALHAGPGECSDITLYKHCAA